jgi:hypothetical protein
MAELIVPLEQLGSRIVELGLFLLRVVVGELLWGRPSSHCHITVSGSTANFLSVPFSCQGHLEALSL